MRRLVLLALLCFSCAYRPTWIERPPIQPGVGSVAPRSARMMRNGGQGVRLCKEISRSHCDTATCKGRALDLVTLDCGGEKLTRCELGKAGC